MSGLLYHQRTSLIVQGAHLRMTINWYQTVQVNRRSWVCGYCGDKVASNSGYSTNQLRAEVCILICPGCSRPTFFEGSKRTPQNAPGDAVQNVPSELHSLYDEARASFAANAYTGAVMICRKILMHIAVNKGSKPNLRFIQYVEYLAEKNFLTPGGRDWVDYIRRRGNEANHEIELMTDEDAKTLISFVEMLLRFIYQFPEMVPPASDA